MKKYKKTYYFDNGNHVEIILNNIDFKEILKDIDRSTDCKFTSEVLEDIGKIVTVNMNKVNFISVEEVNDENN